MHKEEHLGQGSSGDILAAIRQEVGEAEPETSLQDLKLDSLEFVDLLLQMEKTFKVKISDEEVARIDTVADLIAIVSQHLAQA